MRVQHGSSRTPARESAFPTCPWSFYSVTQNNQLKCSTVLLAFSLRPCVLFCCFLCHYWGKWKKELSMLRDFTFTMQKERILPHKTYSCQWLYKAKKLLAKKLLWYYVGEFNYPPENTQEKSLMARKICQQQFKINPLRRKFPPNKWDLAGSFFERTNSHDFFQLTEKKATILWSMVLKNLISTTDILKWSPSSHTHDLSLGPRNSGKTDTLLPENSLSRLCNHFTCSSLITFQPLAPLILVTVLCS